jgi:hypothetical protein
MLGSLFGYFFCMITVLTAVAVLLTGFINIPTLGNGRHHLRPPAIDRTVTVMVETQRHSTATNAPSSAKDVSPVVATANADTKKIKHKPKVLARQRDNYGYWNARGYAQRDFFFR